LHSPYRKPEMLNSNINLVWDKGEWWRGVNSSMIYLIYCKNICKCHSVPSGSTTIKKSVCYCSQKLYL
jgi:hypothetical protein